MNDLKRTMKEYINKKLFLLIYYCRLCQKEILYEMVLVPKTTFVYACLEMGFRIYELKIAILNALLIKIEDK